MGSILKTSVITTINHNIGDDFVREGILYLLADYIGNDTLKLIHKHSPITAVDGLEKIRSTRISNLLEPLTRNTFFSLRNKIDSSDLILQSGAPIFWCHEESHCGQNEWFNPLIRNRYIKNNQEKKFLNIAGGSCQQYHSNGSEFKHCKICENYIRDLYDIADLTLVRDQLAKDILTSLNLKTEVLPCTSIFARDRLSITPKKGEYIVLNYMKNGGHFTFGQDINSENWDKNFIKIFNHTSKLGKVVISCHTKIEQAQVKKLLPSSETFLIDNDYSAFMEFYSKARFAIVNRVHAGFMIASLNKPVIVIGTDSRAKMIEELGLKSFYVEDLPEPEALTEALVNKEFSYQNEIEEIRVRSKKIYQNKIALTLS